MTDWNADAVYERVTSIIGKRVQLDPDGIDRDGSIVDDYGADSLDLLCIAAQIETQFDITIPREALSQVETPGQIADLLVEHFTTEGLIQKR